MKKIRPSCREYAMCLVVVLLSCYAPFMLADSANAPGNPEGEIRDLCTIVLSNPIDSAARQPRLLPVSPTACGDRDDRWSPEH